MENFVARLEGLPFDADAAGHARSFGLIVVTTNLNEFNRIDGLRCENWQA